MQPGLHICATSGRFQLSPQGSLLLLFSFREASGAEDLVPTFDLCAIAQHTHVEGAAGTGLHGLRAGSAWQEPWTDASKNALPETVDEGLQPQFVYERAFWPGTLWLIPSPSHRLAAAKRSCLAATPLPPAAASSSAQRNVPPGWHHAGAGPAAPLGGPSVLPGGPAPAGARRQSAGQDLQRRWRTDGGNL